MLVYSLTLYVSGSRLTTDLITIFNTYAYHFSDSLENRISDLRMRVCVLGDTAARELFTGVRFFRHGTSLDFLDEANMRINPNNGNCQPSNYYSGWDIAFGVNIISMLFFDFVFPSTAIDESVCNADNVFNYIPNGRN
mmetsp:Transcript_4571/g.6749  ORF Transcript_4571/g.6749 Transcript_4571/m.6749 type:complete len:138 (+) Transcript_4571:66-479(+)